MNSNVQFVDYRQSLSVKVGEFLLSKGFFLANSIGDASDRLYETDSLGVLQTDPTAKPVTRFFGLVKGDPRRTFLGVIWFVNEPRRANPRNWVFEMYGSEHVESAKRLAEELVFMFNAKISVQLLRGEPAVERIYADWDY